MKGKVVYALASAIVLLAGVAVYAATWIWSNPVTVTVTEYALTLTVDKASVLKNMNVTFTGTLTKNGSPLGGATVYLYRNGTQIASTTTNNNGQFTFTINCTETGVWEYKAGYQTP